MTMLICIDPGHDAGNTANASPDKTYFEHEFALDVGKRVQTLLESHGLQTIMTRTDGTAVSLSKRCQIANKAQANIFLSIHTNAAGNDGWYTAEGWSAHIIGSGGEAEKIAHAIHDVAIPLLGCKDRGVNVDNYQVLRDTSMPAVLVEHGFHTSKAEVEKLKTNDYRQKCAEADAKGICDYLGIAWDTHKTITIDELKAQGYTKIIL